MTPQFTHDELQTIVKSLTMLRDDRLRQTNDHMVKANAAMNDGDTDQMSLFQDRALAASKEVGRIDALRQRAEDLRDRS